MFTNIRYLWFVLGARPLKVSHITQEAFVVYTGPQWGVYVSTMVEIMLLTRWRGKLHEKSDLFDQG